MITWVLSLKLFSCWLAARDTLDLWPLCGHFKRAAFRAVYLGRPDVLLEEITGFNPLFSSDFIFQDSIFCATLTKALSSIWLWFSTQTRFNLCFSFLGVLFVFIFFEEVTSSFLALFLQLAVWNQQGVYAWLVLPARTSWSFLLYSALPIYLLLWKSLANIT